MAEQRTSQATSTAAAFGIGYQHLPAGSDLSVALAKVEGEHATALRWFLENAGRTVSWFAITANANDGARLVTQAKGIYKPHYTDYALSVRQTLDGTYPDKEIIRRPDGSWVYPYFQENADPAKRDKEATNRGLIKCMVDGVPIGALLQVKPKPGVEYSVLGLAAVTSWRDGYFILEGFSDQGSLKATVADKDASHDRALASVARFAIENVETEAGDLRERQIAEVVRRRGQSKFRAGLLAAYKGKCAITSCDASEALEAAHISPYRGAPSDHPQNGILLRADLHSLFDLGLLAIDPLTLEVKLAAALLATSYVDLNGRIISTPDDPNLAPSAEALTRHLEWAGISDGRS